ncbi:hypothetical protein M3Y97_00891600 [Aphelenchoides bicaudatus]|nr:hypothetical protein M3Y97_00891600 [Aphelenchoides bicaudatus]
MLFQINRFHALVLVTWQFAILFASQMIFPIFSNYVPKWRCSPAEQFSKDCIAFEKCRNTTIEFEYEYFHSTAIEFDWICGAKAYWASFYSQVQFGGVLLGTILFGSLSDCFGRKPVAIFVLTCGLTFQIFSGLAPTWQLLLATRFVIGLSIGGTIVVVCTFVMELILPQQRMALRAFFNWGTARSASIACALTASPMLIFVIFVFPESPTWLHNKGRLQKMRESEQKMARVAGVKYVEKEPEPIVRQKTILDLVRDGTLLKRITVLWCMWFTAAICGYAIDLNSSNISAFSRRNLHQYSQLVVIICFLILTVLALIDEHSIWILVINLIGTVFIEYTWDAVYLCAVEAVPTNMRATSMGSCSLIGRIGAICAPTLTFFNRFWAPSVFVTVVVLGIVNLIVSYCWLVETKNVNLDKVKLESNPTEEEMKMMPTDATELTPTKNNNA